MSHCGRVKIEFCFAIHIELLENDQYIILQVEQYKIQEKTNVQLFCF